MKSLLDSKNPSVQISDGVGGSSLIYKCQQQKQAQFDLHLNTIAILVKCK